MKTKFKFICPHCQHENNVGMEVDSPSDYYTYDDDCENCKQDLGDLMRDKAMLEASECFVLQAEYLMDSDR